MKRYVLRQGEKVISVRNDINEAVSEATMREGRVMLWNADDKDSTRWVLTNPIPGAEIWSIKAVEEGETPAHRSFYAAIKEFFRL